MSKNKMLDIGSNMSFRNKTRESYSLEAIKEPVNPSDKVVKIDIKTLELAPEEWNFYPPLDEEAFGKLVLSILEHGLLHPIVVRKIGEKHIILSGHNRVRAYQAIASEIQKAKAGEKASYFEDSADLNEKDFEQIMAVIKEDISDDEAREIIIDANYVQRQLNQKLITRSVIEKYKLVQEKRKSSGREAYKYKKTRELVAEEFQLSGRHIDRYRKLENLNPQILELFYEGRISLELASKIALLGAKEQEHIEVNYLEDLSKHAGKLVRQLKAGLSIKTINQIFDEILPQENQITLSIRQEGRLTKVIIDDEKIIDKILKIIQ